MDVVAASSGVWRACSSARLQCGMGSVAKPWAAAKPGGEAWCAGAKTLGRKGTWLCMASAVEGRDAWGWHCDADLAPWKKKAEQWAKPISEKKVWLWAQVVSG